VCRVAVPARAESASVSGQYLTYFPQFCREPVNDAAWYPGFTDWDLIRKLPEALRARFTPARGYYDLAADEHIAAQFAALRATHWSGIGLYHYFFDGRFVLNHVEQFILKQGAGVPPFFLIWANETWSKRWVGKPGDIILRQNHSVEPQVIQAHTDHLCRLFNHPAYVRLHGRPVFVIYAAYEIADPRRLLEEYRRAFRAQGFDPIIGFCVSYIDENFDARMFEFSVEFQPRLFFNVMRAQQHQGTTKAALALKRHMPRIFDLLTGLRDTAYRGLGQASRSFDYRDYLQLLERDAFGTLLERTYGIPAIRSAFYSWNNTPRYRGSALVVRHRAGDFEAFTGACERLRARPEWSLVNSWNEWSEGAALEPGRMDIRNYDVDPQAQRAAGVTCAVDTDAR
jgi:hypothetical protein